MECPKCHQEIPDESKFCLKCGTIIEQKVNKCSYCGFEGLPDDALFCPKCGRKRIEITEKEKLEQKEKEIEKAKLEAERIAALKRKQEKELRRQQEEELQRRKEEKNAEFKTKIQPIKDIIKKHQSILKDVEKQHDLYIADSKSLAEETSLLSIWEASSFNEKFGIVKENKKMKYHWLSDKWDDFNDMTTRGWEKYPIEFKDYFNNFIFIISYPFRFIVLEFYLVIIILCSPFYLLGYPFYAIGYLFGLFADMIRYKNLHINQMNELQQKVDSYDVENILIQIQKNKTIISQSEKQLLQITSEYKKWIE